MADQVVTLRLTADGRGVITGVQQVKKGLAEVGNAGVAAGEKASNAFRGTRAGLDSISTQLQRAKQELLGLGAGFVGLKGGQAILRAADDYTNLNSRIRLVTGSQAEMLRVSGQVFDIAQRTRSDLASTGQLYTSVARSTTALGITQAQTARITETLNQSFIVSGASAAASQAAIVQLGQGLASGALRGDEFNSVAEQAPIIMDLLSASLGKTRGELREFAAEGGITAKILTDAILTGAADVQRQFDGMQVTIGGATTMLGNSFTKLVGEASEATGASRSLAAGISLIAENLSTLLSVLTVVGGVLVGRYVGGLIASGLAAARTALAARSLALAWGLAGTAAGGMGSALLALVGGPIGLAVLAIGGLVVGYRALSAASAERAAKLEQERQRVAAATTELEHFADALARPTEIVALAELATQSAAAKDELSKASAELDRQQTAFAGLARAAGLSTAQMADVKGSLDGMTPSVQTVIERLIEQQMIVDRLRVANDALASAMASRLRPEIDAVAEAVLNLSLASPTTFSSLGAALGKALGASGDVSKADAEFQRLLSGAVAQTAELDGKLKTVGKTAVDVAKQTAAAILQSAQSARVSDGQLESARATGQALIAKAEAFAAAEKAAKASGKTDDAAARAAGGFIAKLKEQVATYGQSEAAKRRNTAATLSLTAVQAKEADGLLDTLEGLERNAAAMDALSDIVKGAVNAIAELHNGNVNLDDQLATNADVLAGLTDDQVNYNVALRETNRLIEESLALGPPTAQQQTDAAARLAKLGQLSDQRQNISEMDHLRQAAEDAARKSTQAWSDFTGSLADAILQGGKGVKRWWKSLIDDMLRQIVQSGLLKVFGSIFNTGGARAGGSLLGSLFSGGASANSIGNPNSPNFVGPPSSLAGSGGATVGSVFGGIGAGLLGSQLVGNGSTGAAIGGAIGGGLVSAFLPFALTGILGPLGTILAPLIGGMIGSLIGGLFGSKKPRLEVGGSASGLQNNTVHGASDFGEIFIGRNRKTGADGAELVQNIIKFDNAIAGVVAASEHGSARLTAITGVLATWRVDLTKGSATAEEVLKSRFSAILGTFDAAVQSYVERGDGLESQVQRLADVLAIESGLVKSGVAVTLSEFLSVVDEFSQGGEAAGETAARIIGSVQLLDAALDQSGVSIGKTGAEYVRFAASIAEAAGGLDQARALWENFFTTFYTPKELAASQGQTAANDRATQLTGLGLATDITNEAFRAAFEAALPTATPAQIAQWLRAGAAISAAAAAQDKLNAIYAQAVEVEREHVAAVQAYADAITSLGEELIRGNLTEFGNDIRDINQWSTAAVAELNRLAVAAGESAASEASLVAVHELAARKVAEAMARLRAHALDLVQQLQGSQLDQLNAQIDAINAAAEAQVQGINDVSSAAADAAQAQIEAQQRIRDFVDGILRNPAVGGLRPKDALPIAKAQLQAVFAAAQGGDAAALAQFPQLADEILRLAQQVFPAGSDPFNAIRDSIIAQGNQLAGQPVAPGSGLGGGNAGGAGVATASGDLATLTAQRDQLVADQLAATRLALAQELSAAIRDLVIATGDPLSEIATQLGLNVTDLVTALGVNLTDLTATTASQLAQVAQDMGVNLSELSTQVGVDLGALSDSQSLLNDALEAQISTLPDAQRDALQPLLADVEAAAALGDNAALEAAQAALETAVNDLSPSLKDKLAPFFDNIDPTNFTQLDALSFIDSNTADLLAKAKEQLAELVGQTHLLQGIADATPPLAETEQDNDDIATGNRQDPGRGHGPVYEAQRRNLAAANEGNHFVSYSVGTGYVPRTGLALLHRGEAVLPDPVAAFFRREGIPVARAAGSDPELLAEMRAAREALQAANKKHDETARRLAELEKTTSTGSRELVAATDRQTNTMRSLR